MGFLISQVDDDTQVLRVDYANRYIQNDTTDWQFLFNDASFLTPNELVLVGAGQFDTTDFDSIKLAGYLYNKSNGSVAAGSVCSFRVFLVSPSSWTETLLGTFPGAVLPNNYFYVDVPISSLSPADLDGDNSLMVEVVMTRLSTTFRERFYLNHLGIYEFTTRVKKKVDFLFITKKDI